MATKTFKELKQLAIQIRDEKTNKQNTATRIGTQMLEHLNKLEQDYYDKTATDEELKQRDEKLTELSSDIPFKKYIITGTSGTVKFGSLINFRGETVALTVNGVFTQFGYFKEDLSFVVVGLEAGREFKFIVPEDATDLFIYSGSNLITDAVVEFQNPATVHIEESIQALESFVFSKNEKLQSFFKELYCPDLDLSKVSGIQISKAQIYSVNNTYNNIIRFTLVNGGYYNIEVSSYKTQEEALDALQSGYFNQQGCAVVNWKYIKDGESINIGGVKNLNLTDFIFDINYSPTIKNELLDYTTLKTKVDFIDSEVKSLKPVISNINKEVFKGKYIDINNLGYISSSSGKVISTSSTPARYSDPILVSIGFVLEYVTVISSAGCALAFYDKDGLFIDDIKILGTNAFQKGTYKVEDERIYSVIISQYNYPSASLYVKVENNLQDRVSKLENAILIENSSAVNNISHEGVIKYQRPTKDINHFIIYGQSLSTGQQTCPELSRQNYRGNLMIGANEWSTTGGSSFKLLKAISSKGENYIPTGTSDQTYGETSNINFANAAKRLFDDYLLETVDRKILATSCGAGGTSIELLSKNCPNNSGILYNNFLKALSSAKSIANEDSKSLCCSAIIWMQGEYNAVSKENQGWNVDTPATNNKDDYKKYLLGGRTSDGIEHNGLVNDMIEDVQSQYSQENFPLILASQIGANYNQSFDMPIDMALLEANNESDKFILAAPSYCVTDRGGHLDSNGSRWLGEYYAKVWYKKVILGLNWKPLQPNKIEKGDNYLLITFDVPEPPIVFDTKLVRKKDNYGFKLKDGGNEKSIQSVDIVGVNVVKITCTSSFTGDIEIAYATQGVVYGNLRDSDSWKSFEIYKDLDTIVENPEGVSYKPSFEPTNNGGDVIYNKNYPCYNWCMRFYYKILSHETVLAIN